MIHLDLIDWLSQNLRPKITSFQNDYEITCYLNAIEPVTSSTSEPMVNMMESNIKYLSHKIKRKNKQSNEKYHTVEVFDPQKSKNKDLSNGENLPEALADEVLDSLPSYFQDRSSILIKPTQLINSGIEESPKVIHVAQLLSTEKKENFAKFFQDKKINFTWTYLDIPGLDIDLIMHHLSISPEIKPIK